MGYEEENCRVPALREHLSVVPTSSFSWEPEPLSPSTPPFQPAHCQMHTWASFPHSQSHTGTCPQAPYLSQPWVPLSHDLDGLSLLAEGR